MVNLASKNRKYRILCFALAGSAALFTFSVVILGIIQEAEAVLSEGLSFFISNTLLRFFSGLVISCFSVLPYFFGAIVVSKMKHPLFMFLICLGLFIFDMYLRILFLFILTGWTGATSSTSSIAILYLVLLLAALVLIVWGTVNLVSKHLNDEES